VELVRAMVVVVWGLARTRIREHSTELEIRAVGYTVTVVQAGSGS